MTHITTDTSPAISENAWPVLPGLLVLIAISASQLLRWRATWLADLIALLTVFSITQIIWVSVGKLRWAQWTVRPAWRWLVLCTGILIAITAAVGLQRIFWPAGQMRHPDWLVPAMGLIFVLFHLAPAEMNLEAARRARLVLDAEQARHRIERQLLESRLAALQGQIEPHFLYNTLANTRALIKQDAHAAETMLNHLIAYLRAAMPDLRANTAVLDQELQRAHAYLDILKLRLGDRLQFQIEASEQARACLIPPLAVMTLVENAIKHGIEPQVNGGNVRITARCEQAILSIAVHDDGAGFKNEMGNGIGLLNVQERLQALFGTTAELSMMAGTEGGVTACIRLPAMTQHEQDLV
ncbi:sensor histidine kinase [Undibacterium sp. RuTC16W]|uniref:sensor histidine kinase n=1 Tax=Undibacterium sp. RuTC16W TaxID=3413048 RepID=UPI003BF0FA47